jgi:hypothetical protein
MQMVDKWIAANPDLVAYERRRTGRLPEPASMSPETHRVPDWWKASQHPDLIEQIWGVLGSKLPVDCCRIFAAAPVLARPDTGVVFVYPVGTPAIYALRLPSQARDEAIREGALLKWPYFSDGSNLDISDIGDQWVIADVHWSAEQEEEWLYKAYDYAGVHRD